MQGMRVLDSTGEYVLQFGIRIAACYDTQAASTTVLSMFAPCAAKTVFLVAYLCRVQVVCTILLFI